MTHVNTMILNALDRHNFKHVTGTDANGKQTVYVCIPFVGKKYTGCTLKPVKSVKQAYIEMGM